MDENPPLLKRASTDIGWNYGKLCDANNLDKVQCDLCSKSFSGGVHRLKEHISHTKGNVSACPVSTKEDQARCKQALMEAKNKKGIKRKHEEAIRAEVNINKTIDDELESEVGPLKNPHFQGPIDRFAACINPEASLATQRRQQSIHDAISKEKTHAVQQYCARWIFQSNIPFHAIDNESFRLFCEALGQFGPGWVPPSQYQLREPLLNEECQKTKEKLKSLEEEWAREGCSVMTDAWTDMKKRSIMNLCVNSRGGTCFLSSKDTSKDSHTGEFIFNYIDKCIEDIGAEMVVQVVTDNATNNVSAARMLKEKRPRIFWSGCAAHTLDLMLEGISKLPGFAKVIDQAKSLTIFVYAHHKTLSMMRAHTKKRDIVRPGATRFATCFLTLSSLYEKKAQLKSMFTSDEWHECRHSKCVKGKTSFDTIMSFGFWNSVMLVLKVFSPLVKVLRLADGEKIPSLGFIYGEIVDAKKTIMEATDNLEKNYSPIIQIINEKMKDRLDVPLHIAGYFLNPYYFYKEPTIQFDMEVMDGFMSCVETFFHGDFEKQNEVMNHEVNLYKNKIGSFGRSLALKGCESKENFDPGYWWATYGCGAPILQRLATRNSDAAARDLDKQHAGYTLSPSPSPRSCVKLAFFSRGSNPSTPRPSYSPGLRCRTTDAKTPAPTAEQIPTPRSATKSPVLSSKASSSPSSPRSLLKLSLFRNSFKFRSSCGICLHSLKTGQGTAKYTAECSHAFHFPCIADYVCKYGRLVCPVCNSLWKDSSLLTPHRNRTEYPLDEAVSIKEKRAIAITSSPRAKPRPKQSHNSIFYDDDEPLLSPRFLTIPEDDENGRGGEENDAAQFKGFVVDLNSSFAVKSNEIPANGRDFGNVQVSLLPESVIVSVGCNYDTRAVALRVKTPPPLAARGGVGHRLLDPSQRAPGDLVVVVDVGGTMNSAKLQMVKRAMRLVISSLTSADRLSIIAASSTTPKRLLPLKRMTENGKRSAEVVVDGLICCQISNISDGFEKATRVLEERRARNPIASILLLTDGQGIFSRVHTNQRSTITHVGSTRLAHIEIHVTEYGFGDCGGSHAPAEDAFVKCIGELLSVVVQDLRIQFRVGSGSGPCEISAVYLCSGQPTLVSSGSGSVRLGDLYAGEEREILVELRIPSTASMAHNVLSVRGLYKDPSTQEVVYGPDQSLYVPQAVRSSSPSIERFRSLFITTRAVAESRRLVEYGEYTSAHQLLTSAHALLGQSRTGEAAEYTKVVEAELVEIQRRQQHIQRRRGSERDTTMVFMDENGEPLTPASAWRAAEKLARVAMMKKSDLHSFENARF